MKTKLILSIFGMIALGVSVQASPVTFNFLENGMNTTLGSSSTFTQSGDTLTAYASVNQILYAKSKGPGESGLGINSDPSGDHEIYGSTFVQLDSGAGGFDLSSLKLNSTTHGEIADIWYSTTLGSLGTLIGTVKSNGSFTILSQYQNGFIGVTATGTKHANVLLSSATGTEVQNQIPDGGSTLALFGGTLAGLGFLKRKVLA